MKVSEHQKTLLLCYSQSEFSPNELTADSSPSQLHNSTSSRQTNPIYRLMWIDNEWDGDFYG